MTFRHPTSGRTIYRILIPLLLMIKYSSINNQSNHPKYYSDETLCNSPPKIESNKIQSETESLCELSVKIIHYLNDTKVYIFNIQWVVAEYGRMWWRIIVLFVLSLIVERVPWCRAQFGLIQLDINPDTSSIPVLSLQSAGYASERSWAEYNGTISTPLASFTFCARIQVSLEKSFYEVEKNQLKCKPDHWSGKKPSTFIMIKMKLKVAFSK